MKTMAAFALALILIVAEANELNVLKYTNQVKNNQEVFFLIGTQEGSYTVRSWQFDIQNAKWDGKGEPSLSVGAAIQQAYKYHNTNAAKFGVKSADLRPAFSKKGTVIWFYLITLTPLPYKPFSDELESVVLLSGELLEPYGK
ncbi:hypothetical protein [Salinimonas sediminis]|uniref:Uncharacterized protein n=1 Tax=Salinimonas sediminis TaxID=2303538 RepID=A0A346NM58_9ALTE|nr:hypothetical protein [Salinimonas sediminis]AXR06615.1 hypothetical protein D0Y50_09675 [Salinimonas sediminis]